MNLIWYDMSYLTPIQQNKASFSTCLTWPSSCWCTNHYLEFNMCYHRLPASLCNLMPLHTTCIYRGRQDSVKEVAFFSFTVIHHWSFVYDYCKNWNKISLFSAISTYLKPQNIQYTFNHLEFRLQQPLSQNHVCPWEMMSQMQHLIHNLGGEKLHWLRWTTLAVSAHSGSWVVEGFFYIPSEILN